MTEHYLISRNHKQHFVSSNIPFTHLQELALTGMAKLVMPVFDFNSKNFCPPYIRLNLPQKWACREYSGTRGQHISITSRSFMEYERFLFGEYYQGCNYSFKPYFSKIFINISLASSERVEMLPSCKYFSASKIADAKFARSWLRK